MAHFAKIGKGNIVQQVVVVENNVFTTEKEGVEFLQKLYGIRDLWKQTSYNTYGGEHLNGETPLRKNFANIGYTYDETRDAFIAPKPFESWTLNETTCQWEAPVALPDTENRYNWNEETKQWDLDE
jgi:hypothetical protein